MKQKNCMRNVTGLFLVGAILFAGCSGKSQETTEETKTETPDVPVDTVETDRCSMEFCRFGKGDRTLVIVPGLSVQSVMPSANLIAEAYKELADDFTVYVFDRRKGVLPEGYSVADMAEDTAAAMEALSIEQADVFGASQGGMITLKLAADHPELVHKIIVGSSAARVSEDPQAVIESWIDLAQEGNAKDLYLLFGETIYPEDVYEGYKDALIQAAETVTEEDLARFVILAGALKGLDLREDIARITCPALVIGSETDKVFGREGSDDIAAGLTASPDCRLYIYDAYGHAVYDLAPDYKTRMRDFLLEEN
jgi:pimeloyl-ACP methyl ester carboxylesterase